VEIIGRSDIGKVRKNNEDFIDYDEAKGIAVLADGMGGLDAGEIASRTAVQEIMTKLAVSSDVREDALLKAVAAANRSVFSQTQVGGRSSNMGTTVVVWNMDSVSSRTSETLVPTDGGKQSSVR